MPADPADPRYEAWDLEALADIPNYQDWILGAFRPYLAGEAVEIGAGTGTFSRRLLAHVDCLELVEPAPELARRLAGAFAGEARVGVVARTAEEYLADASPVSRDCAVMINVLEHLADDTRVMAGLFRLLKPGGHLLVFVPALPWLFGAMDEALGHYRRYRRAALIGLARDQGFEVIADRYFDFFGVLPWWVVHTLAGRTRFNRRLSGVYDRLVVPVGRAIEIALPPPIGKNLVLVARKPGGGLTL
ncbi:MAG: methyltransferase domain-containing protein [Rhodospirillales bacterium]|nr:methyltransferase domain-containing protein [Rhodospirillales bacterium]MBI2979185.1 methyltransferase domain-containing protein [Rhodospirillales bacterium]